MPGPASTRAPVALKRVRLDVAGAVQGVGFRPFVHRLATAEGLAGFVQNTGEGARLEIEGAEAAISRFMSRLDAELPSPASVASRMVRELPAIGTGGFAITASTGEGRAPALVLPDLVTCPDCLADIFDPADRRHLYPFTTCARCGPRYSLIEATPYDRARTAMRRFEMCPACRAEYDDPASRRFHAETIACPDCGPQVMLRDNRGRELSARHDALRAASDALRAGGVLALKGLGGFQLLADARNEDAVQRLRTVKHRPRKPFAVMVADLDMAHELALIGPQDADVLASGAGPIVLLPARAGAPVCAAIAPSSPLVGLMLPTTPLHHILMRGLGFPIVATSGNRGNEPIVGDERAALEVLAGMADLFLVHDRPILRPVDDSVVRIIAGRPAVLRAARGYAPVTVSCERATASSGLALGGHQKSALALAGHGQVILGPHIGDLTGLETRARLEQSARALSELYSLAADWIAADTHPDYFTTQFADRLEPPVHHAPHHLAHVLSGMLDNGLDGAVLGIAWDGTGHGEDGTIWGGEFIAVDGAAHRRVGHLLPFHLLGGEAAMREPRRCALGLLHALEAGAALERGDLAPLRAFTPDDIGRLRTMLARGLNAPLTSSAGRLFDAVASLLGLCQTSSFEGEAAMAVEFAAGRAGHAYPLAPVVLATGPQANVLDWRPAMKSLVEAVLAGGAAEPLALGFHEALAQGIVATAHGAGIHNVLLTGGCFQNALLAGLATEKLEKAGFSVYRHHRIPPNDGGLAAGQALWALMQHEETA